MSTLKAATVQTDTVAAKDGQGIPNNLRMLTPFCYGTVNLKTPQNSHNVSSVTVDGDTFVISFINAASSTAYSIVSMRNGDENDSYTYTTSYASGATKTTAQFRLTCRRSNEATKDANEFSFLVFDKGQTI